MQKPPITKYQPFPQVDLPDRTWPDRVIDHAPVWCSVDLRDGNQALPVPMSVEEKLEMFEMLVQIGFKQIEVGFPSASQIEFDFMRRLIDEKRIPDDVTIQTLVQSREDLINRTFESIRGAKSAIVHLYNSTSPLQRRVVFKNDKAATIALAVKGAELIRQRANEFEAEGTRVMMEYSPESFSQTETAFAVEICEAVMDVWQPTVENKLILNLPATVEVYTPNIHADQIEWFGRKVKDRDKVLISLHTHNDRGTGIAATELGLMAGADRVEGTLFGNGERTGNLDIVTVALNMYSQGVDPGLNFSDLTNIRDIYERTTRMEVHPRSPYGGDLVFTAFSGSHQDAINKGLKIQKDQPEDALYEVPYLPIDPADLGRNYRAIIRINSQSGKGGVAWILEQEFGYQLPKAMHREIGQMVNRVADKEGQELSPDRIHELFLNEYLENKDPVEVISAESDTIEGGVRVTADVVITGEAKQIVGVGNGPIDAFVHALREAGHGHFELMSYSEHSLGRGAKAAAACYIEIKTPGKASVFGAGVDTSIELASLKAVASAVNRAGA